MLIDRHKWKARSRFAVVYYHYLLSRLSSSSFDWIHRCTMKRPSRISHLEQTMKSKSLLSNIFNTGWHKVLKNPSSIHYRLSITIETQRFSLHSPRLENIKFSCRVYATTAESNMCWRRKKIKILCTFTVAVQSQMLIFILNSKMFQKHTNVPRIYGISPGCLRYLTLWW